MNPSDLSNFDNIKITDGAGADISYLFNSPVLSEDGLLLTIKPDQAKIVEKIPLGKTLKIEVTLSNAIRENQERNTKFSGYSFYYKACNVEDEQKPSINSFSITRNLFDFDSMTSYSKELSKKSFEDLGAVTEQDFQEQLVSDSLFIKVNATDAESGIKALRIIETLVKDSNGIDNGGIISSDELSVFTEVEENIFETEYTYKILSSNGLIKLDISILDHSNNDVTYTYYVLKHVYDEASEIPYKFYVEPDDKKNFEKAYAVRYADENGVDNVQDNVIYKEVFNSRVNDIYSTELLDYRYPDSAINWYFFEEGTSMKAFDYYVISDSVKDNWYTHLEGYYQCESQNHKGFKVPVTYKNYIKVFPYSEVLDSHSYPIYIYNPYYTALFSESLDDDMNVLYKDAFEGMSGVQLYYDAPVLVETLYCYADMPSIEEWEARGISAKVEVLNPDAEKTFTTNYYPADSSIIESGCYYVVMVHFADGTKWCSTSKYKK